MSASGHAASLASTLNKNEYATKVISIGKETNVSLLADAILSVRKPKRIQKNELNSLQFNKLARCRINLKGQLHTTVSAMTWQMSFKKRYHLQQQQDDKSI